MACKVRLTLMSSLGDRRGKLPFGCNSREQNLPENGSVAKHKGINLLGTLTNVNGISETVPMRHIQPCPSQKLRPRRMVVFGP